MIITDDWVIVRCPSRNVVTLKLMTDEGLDGLGDATLNGRELAVVKRDLAGNWNRNICSG
jgi:mannonate dehydratase